MLIKDFNTTTKTEFINKIFSNVLNNCNSFNFSTMSKSFLQSFIQNFLLNQNYLCESSLYLIGFLLEKSPQVLFPFASELIDYLCTVCGGGDEKVFYIYFIFL